MASAARKRAFASSRRPAPMSAMPSRLSALRSFGCLREQLFERADRRRELTLADLRDRAVVRRRPAVRGRARRRSASAGTGMSAGTVTARASCTVRSRTKRDARTRDDGSALRRRPLNPLGSANGLAACDV